MLNIAYVTRPIQYNLRFWYTKVTKYKYSQANNTKYPKEGWNTNQRLKCRTQFTRKKKDATAIEVANPDPTSLEFEGNNSPL